MSPTSENERKHFVQKKPSKCDDVRHQTLKNVVFSSDLQIITICPICVHLLWSLTLGHSKGQRVKQGHDIFQITNVVAQIRHSIVQVWSGFTKLSRIIAVNHFNKSFVKSYSVRFGL